MLDKYILELFLCPAKSNCSIEVAPVLMHLVNNNTALAGTVMAHEWRILLQKDGNTMWRLV